MTKKSKLTMASGTEPIVFFGSGPVAAKALRLLAKNFTIEAVVTKPKPGHHRDEFPVLATAEELRLKVLEVSDKKSLSDLFAGKPVNGRIGVVIDFGIIIPQSVINYFEIGIVNSHFSLLPRWRGADPISFAILSGDAKTGVSLMVIDAGLDTGKLITQKSLKIAADDTTPSLTEKLIDLSNLLLTVYLPKYITGDIKPHNQPHSDRATYSRKLSKNDSIIDWNKPAEQIEREIRAYLDWPKSHTKLGDTDVVITKAHVVGKSGSAGQISIENRQLVVSTGNNALLIDKLKPTGKSEMTGSSFVNGYLSSADSK
ncbi:MAG: methionyl-tRNA formyltransferase [Candidatus Saccharimonadales bacterium]